MIVGGEVRHVVGYLKDFLFSPEQIRTPLRVLSGGERGRVMLARALAKPSNLLVLDEPTNDLDLETLDVLEEMLANYAGTILLISHDRDFLDRIATSVIVPEGRGRWQEYAGGYTDMLSQRGQDLTRPAAKPAAGFAVKPRNGPRGDVATGDRKRLTFHQQHALKALPARILALNQEIATLQRRLSEPALFDRDRAGFVAASDAVVRKAQELEAAETEWLELEILREEIDA